jgi:hypothetical protein
MPKRWVRRGGSGTATVHVDLAGGERGAAVARRLTTRITLRAGARYEGTAAGAEAAPFLVAYGSARAPGDGAPQDDSTLRIRVANLLTNAPLAPLGAWLRGLGRKRREETLAILDALLPPDTRFAGRMEGDEYVFENRELPVPLSALSDGMQSHIAWVADLLFHLNRAAPKGTALAELPGILLVDELDQRLHPRWQLRVLQSVSAALPRLQFIGSSHSPLIAGSLRPENLLLLAPDRDRGPGATRARRLREDVFGLPSDRVLTSSYFDLDSTRASAFRAHLRKLVELARSGDPEASLEFMQALADSGAARPRQRRR